MKFKKIFLDVNRLFPREVRTFFKIFVFFQSSIIRLKSTHILGCFHSHGKPRMISGPRTVVP
jgi:hypothetical protein